MIAIAVVGLLAGLVVNFDGLPPVAQVLIVVFAFAATATAPQALLVALLARVRS